MIDIEEMNKIANQQKREREAQEKHYEEIRRQELAKQGITMINTPQLTEEDKLKSFHGDCDSVFTLENGSATVLYILIMLVGGIFNDRILIWIIASIIYLNFITRHSK